jgi:hypothetical protein
MAIPFGRTDVWLFFCIAPAAGRRSVSLDRVIGRYDAMNRDIFTAPELRTGLAKLTQAGLVEADAGRFRLTPEGRALYRRCRGGGIWSEWAALEQEFSVNDAPIDEAAWPYPQLTDEMVQEAYEKYSRRFEAGLRFWRR